MSIYDQIAQGVQPIGRDLPQIASMNENRNRYRQLADFQREQFDYRKSRDAKQDQALADAANARENFLGAQWVLRSPNSKQAAESQFPKAVQELREAGLNWDAQTDDDVRALAQRILEHYGPLVGEGPPAVEATGTLYKTDEGGAPVYRTGREAIGKRAYEAPSSEGRGTWGQPFEAVDPETGERGLYQSHSTTGAIRPAQVGPKALQPKPDRTSDSTADESLIYRQVVGAFGGTYDPVTGRVVGIDKETAARLQGITARASRIYQDAGGRLQIAEAVDQAMRQARGDDGTSAGQLPPEAAARLKPGIVTTFANGQRWTIKDGQPVQVK